MTDSKKKLNIAMIGHGFIARAHSNAFHQVGRFFPVAYDLNLRVICGRNRPNLEAMASQWGWHELATDWQEVVNRSDIRVVDIRSEEHTSELQSRSDLVCRLLLEK